MDRLWYKSFDYSLEVLQGKMDEAGQMTPEILAKIQAVQAQEDGIAQMALERFGHQGGQTAPVPTQDRAWNQ